MKPNRVTQIASWGILILLVAVPLFVVVEVGEAHSWWVVWSVVSIWVTLDSVNLAAAAFPGRSPHRKQSVAIIALGLLNLLASLFAILLPVASEAARK